MRSIRITDGANTVTLPPGLKFTITPQRIGETVTMASGKTVIDVVGIKHVLEIPTGYLSVSDLSLLRSMINSNSTLYVTYPDLDGDKTASFIFDLPVLKSFKYDDDGVSVWYGVTLRATQEGVDS